MGVPRLTVFLFPIMVPLWLLLGLAHVRQRWPRQLWLSLLAAWALLVLALAARAVYVNATVPWHERGYTWSYVVVALVAPPVLFLVLEFLYWLAEDDPGGMPRLPGEPGYASPHVPGHERGVRWEGGWYWRRGLLDGAWWRSRAAGGPWEPAEPSPTRRRIEIDPEDADLLLSLCEPGSTLEEPTITEGNYRRFVVARAEAERLRRLESARL